MESIEASRTAYKVHVRRNIGAKIMETLKYCKVREVKSPVRAHAEDAGIDFYIPEDIDEQTFGNKCDVTKCYPATRYENGFLKSITLAPG